MFRRYGLCNRDASQPPENREAVFTGIVAAYPEALGITWNDRARAIDGIVETLRPTLTIVRIGG